MSETVQALLRYRVDLDKPAGMTVLREPLATADKLAYGVHLSAVSGGQAASLAGVQAIGYMVRADGATVATDTAAGTADGVTVWLPEACYAVPGRFSLVVKLLGNQTRRAVLWLEGRVESSASDAIVDTSDVIPSIDELLAQISAMETATAAATAAAASVSGMTANATALPAGSDPTAEMTEQDGHKVLALGIPKGADGVSPALSIGTVTTGDPGTDASASITGTAASPVLNLTIPRGSSGGVDGKTPTIGTNGNWWIGTTDTGIFAGTSVFLFVGPHGCQYTSLTDAVSAAKLTATAAQRVCIVVMPGVYTGSIELMPNPGIDIIALAGAEIVGDTAYPAAALHTVGDGTFVGLTFHSSVAGTYALHIEALEDATSGTQRFVGCSFDGVSAGVGIGEGDGFHQIFERCAFSGGRSAYLHNNPNVQSAATARFENCVFRSLIQVQNYTSNANGGLELTFAGCVANGVTYTSGALNGTATDTHYIPSADSAVVLTALSTGNSNNGLNYGRGRVLFSATGYFLSSGMAIVPVDARGYSFELTRVTQADGYTAISGATAATSAVNLVVTNTSGYSGAFFIEGALVNAQ